MNVMKIVHFVMVLPKMTVEIVNKVLFHIMSHVLLLVKMECLLIYLQESVSNIKNNILI